MEYGILTIVAIIGIFQGLFLAIHLLIPTKHSKFTYPKLFLGLLIVFLCLHCIDSVLTSTKGFYNYPHFFAVKDPLVLLYGPLVFLYVRSLINPGFKFKWLQTIHLLPFLIFTFRIAPLYFKSAGYKKEVLDHMYTNYTEIRDIEINLIFNTHVLTYLLIAVIGLIKLRYSNRLQEVPFRRKDIWQISAMMISVLVIFTVNIIRFWVSFNAETILWMPLVITVLFLIIGYKSLRIEGVLGTSPETISNRKVQKFVQILQSFESEIIHKKLYLDPSLDLGKAASYLSTNRQYLSNTINELKGMSFNKYINKCRIEQSREFLASKEYSNYSLEKIAEDSGFNSLSTFQRAFKEFEGVSPSKYRVQKSVNL